MTTMRSAIADGVRVARRAWPVAVILWAWTALVAGPAALPFFMWLRGQLAGAPEGDLLLERFRFDLFSELTRSAQGPAWAAITGAVLAMIVVAAVSRAFITGALVASLGSGEQRGTLRQFFGGGGRWFLPNLAVLVLNVVAAGVVLVAVSLVTSVLALIVTESPSPVVAWIELLLPLVPAALVVVFFAIVYDYACIRVARGQAFWRAWFGALLFTARHLFGTVTLWLAAGAVTLVAALVYLGFRGAVPATSWATIVLMIVAQQAFMLVRAWLRAALVASEIQYSYSPAPEVPLVPTPAAPVTAA